MGPCKTDTQYAEIKQEPPPNKHERERQTSSKVLALEAEE